MTAAPMWQVTRMLNRLTHFLAFLTLTILLHSSAWASSSEQGGLASVHRLELNEAFREAYFSKAVYTRNYCGVNIKRLLEHFESRQLSLVEPRVLFLLSEKHRYAGGPVMSGPLWPASNRSFAREWDFHVVLVARDPNTRKIIVFDLDSPKPEPSPLLSYFQAMFPENPERTRWSGMQIRVIDSQLFLGAFEAAKGLSNAPTTLIEERVVGAFLKSASAPFALPPSQSLHEFIARERGDLSR